MNLHVSYKSHKQMSEAFITAAFLSVSGGLQDAYTYICRGKVFANAQTGNIVLLSQNLFERNFNAAIHYLVPLLFFAFGVAAAELIRQKYQKSTIIHWRQLVLITEILPAAGRLLAWPMESSGECHGFLLLRHAGTSLPQSQQLRFCQHHVHRKPAKRYGVSLRLSPDSQPADHL